MLNKAQKQYLKGLANTLKPLVQIGKNGLNDNIIMSVDEILTAHEIVKITVLNTCETSSNELALDIAGATGAEIVSQLGHKIVLYRKNPKKTSIELPR